MLALIEDKMPEFEMYLGVKKFIYSHIHTPYRCGHGNPRGVPEWICISMWLAACDVLSISCESPQWMFDAASVHCRSLSCLPLIDTAIGM